MSKKLYEENSIKAIADAIRGKNGSTDTYKLVEMAAAITAIETGGGAQPQLNAPTISITKDTLTITPNKNNGNFVTGYNVYVDPGTGYMLFGQVTTLVNDLTQYQVPPGDYKIKITAAGENFIESDYSNELNYTNVFYTVTNTLTNCTSNNSTTSIRKGSAYSATITANSGYSMGGATVSINMGGTDITSTAYNNGIITVSKVTDNITINVNALKGITWTATPAITYEWGGKPGFLVYTGSCYMGFFSNKSFGRLYSADGVNWENPAIVSTNYETLGAAVGADMVFQLTYREGNTVPSGISAYKLDGTHKWTDDLNQRLYKPSALIYTGNRFLIVGGQNHVTIATKNDRGYLDFTHTTTLPTLTSGYWGILGKGGNTIVAIAQNSISNTNTFAYSTDNGDSWTEGTMPENARWQSIAYGNGKFIAVATSLAAISADGISWSVIESNISGMKNIAFGNGMFVITPSAGTTGYFSTDGITWGEMTMPESAEWQALTYGNGKFVSFPATTNSNGAYTV